MIHIYNIIELRKKKGWTQEMLSDVSGVHRILIANYEKHGTGMTLTTAKKLANALGCTIDDLYKKTETA